MTEIKAVFFDIDGTLRPLGTDFIPDSTKRAVAELQAKGIFTGIATGRNYYEIKKEGLLQELHFPILVTVNGSLVWENDEAVFRCPVERAQVQRILKMAEERPFAIGFNEEREVYLNFIDDKVIETHEYIKTPPFPVKEILPRVLENDIYQLMVYAGHDRMQEIVAGLDNVSATQWHYVGFDIGSSLTNKGVGIDAVIKKHGFTRENVLAFGDGDNDMDMLKYAGIGVAMGNAKDEVKAHADLVCEADIDDGIVKTLKRLGLIE